MVIDSGRGSDGDMCSSNKAPEAIVLMYAEV